jgi:ATP phosphoribosyltransferase
VKKKEIILALSKINPNVKIIFLHAKEIIQRLGDGTLDIGVSGLDLLKESDKNLQGKINIQKKLDYGNANLSDSCAR